MDPAVFVYWWVRAASVWKRTRKSVWMTRRKGHLHRTDSSSSTQQNKEDILPTKHTLPPTAPHIHPGALQQRREELLPVFPPTWKEPSAVRIIFIFQPNVKSWHGHQCSFFLWWFTHFSTASDALWNVNRNKGGTPVQRWILQGRHKPEAQCMLDENITLSSFIFVIIVIVFVFLRGEELKRLEWSKGAQIFGG